MTDWLKQLQTHKKCDDYFEYTRISLYCLLLLPTYLLFRQMWCKPKEATAATSKVNEIIKDLFKILQMWKL